MPLSWTFARGLLWVRCRFCADLFQEDPGTDLAEDVSHMRGMSEGEELRDF